MDTVTSVAPDANWPTEGELGHVPPGHPFYDYRMTPARLDAWADLFRYLIRLQDKRNTERRQMADIQETVSIQE